MTATGLFLVFEGGEGSGKSTQIQRLRTFLEESGHKVVVTREPGGSSVGEELRRLVLQHRDQPISPKTEALIYAADRAQHVEEVIRPALEAGAAVISDRYVDSSIAYQGLARGLGLEQIESLNHWGTGGLLPDLVFLLDLDPAVGLRRSGETDRIESEGVEFHVGVRDAYLQLADRYADRFRVLDAGLPPMELETQIKAIVQSLLERAEAR
ncbi:MAG TPA: dTMP kinase [Actinomycetota bacterium]|nr:dTMP kinase [Actinomycetota bacterium]